MVYYILSSVYHGILIRKRKQYRRKNKSDIIFSNGKLRDIVSFDEFFWFLRVVRDTGGSGG